MLSVTSVVEDIRVLTHKMTSQKGDFRKNEAIALWRFNTLYFRLLNAAFSFHLFFFAAAFHKLKIGSVIFCCNLFITDIFLEGFSKTTMQHRIFHCSFLTV